MLSSSDVEIPSLKKPIGILVGKDFSSIPIEQLFRQLHSSEKGMTPALAAKRVREQLRDIKKTKPL